MGTEEQKAKMLEMAQKSQDLLHKQVALMQTITPEIQDSDPEQVTTVLDQVDELREAWHIVRQELRDYRNSVLKGTEE